MMTDALFKYYLLTNDNRAVTSIQKWANWLDTFGFTKIPWGTQPWEARPTIPWYYATDPSLVGKTATYKGQTVTLDPSWGEGNEGAHNMQMTNMMAMGYWASGRTDQRYLNRIGEVFPVFLREGGNAPNRKFNWALRESSQFLYFLSPNTPRP